jgi:hypothetical protein
MNILEEIQSGEAIPVELVEPCLKVGFKDRTIVGSLDGARVSIHINGQLYTGPVEMEDDGYHGYVVFS